MDTKLTLKLNKEIIEEAKKYACEKNISLSKLIESYLERLARPVVSEPITPLVKQLAGTSTLAANSDARAAYQKYISDKYKS
ncbi:MAG: hypothetical protein FJ348_07575 [Sphingomonadales bacterium]|nr:hypothetical protein [Sphingomonadales bacterium]